MPPLLALLVPVLSGFLLLCEPPVMEFSAIGRAALVGREGCELVAYQDSVDVWTIACGVTSASGLIVVKKGLTLTQAQADDLNRRAFEQYAAQVRKLLKRAVTQEQFDALVSLNYNIGPANLAKSTVLRKLNAGDAAGAAEAFLMWNKPASITSRRQAEYDQFLTPYATALPKARRGDRAPVRVLTNGLPVAAAPAQTPPAPVAAPAPGAGTPGLLARIATLFGRPRA